MKNIFPKLSNPTKTLLNPTYQLSRNFINISPGLREVTNRSLVTKGLLGSRYLPMGESSIRQYSGVPERKITEEEKAKKELYQKLKSKAKSDTSEEDIDKLAEAIFPFYQQHKDLQGKKIMILFSGGLDTSFMTHILQNIIGAEIITFSGNVGSVTAPVNMQEIANRSKEVGAVNHVEVDCREYLAGLAFNAINAEATLGVAGIGGLLLLKQICVSSSSI